MKLKVLLAVSLAVAMAGPAFAKDDGNDKEPAEKKICRTETVTGSLVAKRRVCMTQKQWDELAANSRKNLDDYSRRQGRGAETGSGIGANSGF